MILDSYTETYCAVEHVPVSQSRTYDILQRFHITLTYEVEIHVRHSDSIHRIIHPIRDQSNGTHTVGFGSPEIKKGQESPSPFSSVDF